MTKEEKIKSLLEQKVDVHLCENDDLGFRTFAIVPEVDQGAEYGDLWLGYKRTKVEALRLCRELGLKVIE